MATYVIWTRDYFAYTRMILFCCTKLPVSEPPETHVITIWLPLGRNLSFFLVPLNLGAFKSCGWRKLSITLEAASEVKLKLEKNEIYIFLKVCIKHSRHLQSKWLFQLVESSDSSVHSAIFLNMHRQPQCHLFCSYWYMQKLFVKFCLVLDEYDMLQSGE